MNSLAFEEFAGAQLREIGAEIAKGTDATPTPFPSWNSVCGEEGGKEGLARSWLVVLGGSDGSGKSYLAINCVANAVKLGHKVGYVNFEMTRNGLAQRYLSILTGFPKYKLEHGKFFCAQTWEKACQLADAIYAESGGALVSHKATVFNLDDIERSYQFLTDKDCKMVFVDYAQLVNVPGTSEVYLKTEKVSNALRELTHKYDVTTLVVSQLNREGKKLEEDREPSRHFLTGGGCWENNANQIVLIDHNVHERDLEDDLIRKELKIDKNRHGIAPVKIPIIWYLNDMKWEEEYVSREVSTGVEQYSEETKEFQF